MTIAHHPIDFDAVEGDFFELGTVHGETRWVRSRLSSPVRIGAVAARLKRGAMAWLDASQGVLKALTPSNPDLFGDAVRAAQERPDEPAPTYTPDDFTAKGFDRDEAFKRAMGGEG